MNAFQMAEAIIGDLQDLRSRRDRDLWAIRKIDWIDTGQMAEAMIGDILTKSKIDRMNAA